MCAGAMSEVRGKLSFSVEPVIRGYHEYKDVWVAVVGEELLCMRELPIKKINLL